MEQARSVTDLGTVWGAASEAGPVRLRNEDSWLVEPPLFAVADGMGGHSDGALASSAALRELAVRMRPEALSGREADLVDLDRAVASAAAAVGALAGPDVIDGAPGTTLTGALVLDEGESLHWLTFNIGDSRTYLLADGQIRQVTRDHSLLQEILDRAPAGPPEGMTVPTNVVTRALGAGTVGLPKPDYTISPLVEGDLLVLCTDGVHGSVDAETIALTVTSASTPQAAAEALVAQAIASGSQDNVTAVVVQVKRARRAPGLPEGVVHREIRPACPASIATTPRLRHKGDN